MVERLDELSFAVGQLTGCHGGEFGIGEEY
jgi:hypothetical protein